MAQSSGPCAAKRRALVRAYSSRLAWRFRWSGMTLVRTPTFGANRSTHSNWKLLISATRIGSDSLALSPSSPSPLLQGSGLNVSALRLAIHAAGEGERRSSDSLLPWVGPNPPSPFPPREGSDPASALPSPGAAGEGTGARAVGGRSRVS